MKIAFLAFAAALLSMSSFSRAADSASSGSHGELFHIVALKFKEGASQDKIKEVEDAFAALKTKVPGVRSLKWGTNVSPEQRNKGYTHCFVLTFATEKDRDGYLVHPAHKDFGKLLGPILGDVLVIDFAAHE